MSTLTLFSYGIIFKAGMMIEAEHESAWIVLLCGLGMAIAGIIEHHIKYKD